MSCIYGRYKNLILSDNSLGDLLSELFEQKN